MLPRRRKIRIAALSAWILAIAVALGDSSGCASPSTESSAAPPYRVPAHWEQLHAPFLRESARLYWASSISSLDKVSHRWVIGLESKGWTRKASSGRPLEPQLRLVAVREYGLQPISWPAQLAGMAQVASGQSALDFVRLFSSPTTWHRFPDYGFMEIVPSDSERLEPGEVRRSDWSVLGLPEPQVVADGGAYRVLRSVVRIQLRDGWPEPASVAIIDESVAPDGRYGLRVLFEKDLTSRKDFVSLWDFR